MWGESNKTRKMSLWIIWLLDCISLSIGRGKTILYRMPHLSASLRSANSLTPHQLSAASYSEFDATNTFQTSWNRSKKKMWNDQKTPGGYENSSKGVHEYKKDVTTWGREHSWFAVDCILLLFTFYTVSRVLWNLCCNKNLTMANLSALSRQTKSVSHQRTSQKIGPICWRQSYFCGLTELVLSVLLFRGTLHFQREWVRGRERKGDTRRRRDESERDERGRNKQPEKERKVRELSQTDTKAVTRKALNTHSLNYSTYSSLQLIQN